MKLRHNEWWTRFGRCKAGAKWPEMPWRGVSEEIGKSVDARTHSRYSRQCILHFNLFPRHCPIQFSFHILQRLIHLGILKELWILEDRIRNISICNFSFSIRVYSVVSALCKELKKIRRDLRTYFAALWPSMWGTAIANVEKVKRACDQWQWSVTRNFSHARYWTVPLIMIRVKRTLTQHFLARSLTGRVVWWDTTCPSTHKLFVSISLTRMMCTFRHSSLKPTNCLQHVKREVIGPPEDSECYRKGAFEELPPWRRWWDHH